MGSRYNFTPLRSTKSLEVTTGKSITSILLGLINLSILKNENINLPLPSLRVSAAADAPALYKKCLSAAGRYRELSRIFSTTISQLQFTLLINY